MRKKTNTVTCQLDQHFNKTLDKIIKTGIPLEVGLGKYSAYIKTINDNTKYKFITKLQSKRTFIGYAKILSDLKRPEVDVILSDLQDSISEANNMYYDLQTYHTVEYDSAVCVDLNSAYLQALFNIGLITEKTKDWIQVNLKKDERLVCVGMLAKQKEILHFNKGKIQQDYLEPSKHRFIFNAIIQEVAAVMNKVKSHHIDDFIAYWVDGIYLKNEFIAIDIVEEFEKAGYPCKIENITNFKSEFKFSYMQYSYMKDGKSKILSVPIKKVNDNMKKDLMRLVNGYRRENMISEVDLNFEDVYIGALQNKQYSQADLFD
jgi:hypothetical protein